MSVPTATIGVARFSRCAAALVTVYAGLHSPRIVREDTEEFRRRRLVALPRVRTGAGLSFARSLRERDVNADPVLLAFMKWASGDAAS
jgi:hypothetical protein